MRLLRSPAAGPWEEDRRLVRRMLAGDEKAFDDFFSGQFPGLYRFALRRLGSNPELAEEIAQTAICNAIDHLEQYRGEASLTTWLFTICRYEILSQRRKAGLRPAEESLEEETPEVRAALESLRAGPEGPEEAASAQEVAGLVHLALDRLPTRYRQALSWKYFESLPVKEIARRLEVGPKAAESLLTRAREAFRDAFSTLSQTHSPPQASAP